MSELVLDQGSDADAVGIAAVIAALATEQEDTAAPAAASAADVQALLGALGERGAVFVCREDGAVVGFAAVQPDPTADDTAALGVWLLPTHRRRGLGTHLAREATNFAREQGYRRFRGTIPADNETALSFFSAVGPLVRLEGGDMRYELPVEAE